MRATSSEVERSSGEAVEEVAGQILHLVGQQERARHEVGQHAQGFKDLHRKEIGRKLINSDCTKLAARTVGVAWSTRWHYDIYVTPVQVQHLSQVLHLPHMKHVIQVLHLIWATCLSQVATQTG